MNLKERYKYFPIEKLDEKLSEVKNAIEVFTKDGAVLDGSSLSLSPGKNKIEIKSSGDIKMDVRVPKNQTSILEISHHRGSGSFCLNVKMDPNSTLSIVDLTETYGFLKSSFNYETSSDCTLNVTTIDINNKMISRDQIFDINSPGTHIDVKGLFISSKDEYVDNYIKMNHNAPRSESNQDFRGVSSSMASFLGHIYIAPDSQQSIAMQQSRNIVVGQDAHIYARPWLEIYADDVKCNHGATVGTSDEEALFYLCQRGIPKNMAKALLLEGFVSSILGNVPSLKRKVQSKLYKL